MNKVVEISNLMVGYPNNPKVLNDVCLNVYQNDFLGIIGPNGGGKTTLLKTIMGLIRPNKGSIKFYRNGEQTKINVGYLPQVNQIDKTFPISVREVILSGMKPQNNLFRPYTNIQKDKVANIAEQMGLKDLLSRPIGELSGGQLQRTLLGRALVDDPELLILDEPNSYVDKKFESSFYKTLEKLNERTAIILVSHDIGTVVSMVKNIACVNEGLHYHAGRNVSTEWLAETYSSCPIEIIGHGDFPHRVLDKHEGCDCCQDE